MLRDILLPSKYQNLDDLVADSVKFWNENCQNDLHIYDLKCDETLQRYRKSLPVELLQFINDNSADDICTEFANYLCNVPNAKVPPCLQTWIDEALNLQLPFECDFMQEFGLEISKCVGDDRDCTLSGMGTKKYHEVHRISELLSYFIAEYGIQYCIDIGCGMGYLSHHLGQTLPVVGLEIDEKITKAARERTRKRNIYSANDSIVEFVNFKVTASNFETLATKSNTVNKMINDSKCIIISLHACGDLSASAALKNLYECPWIHGSVTVGCCYHQLNTQDFPNSLKLQSFGLKMSKGSLKLGEQTFTNFNPARLCSLWQSQTNDIITQNPLANSDYIRRHVALLSLQRNYIGRVVESLVLLDRFLLGKEYGFEMNLVPIFDKAKSPRSFCLLAFKK